MNTTKAGKGSSLPIESVASYKSLTLASREESSGTSFFSHIFGADPRMML
jgi:hypothetical protein